MILILVEIQSDKQEVVEIVDEGEDGQEIEGGEDGQEIEGGEDGQEIEGGEELNYGDGVIKNLEGEIVRSVVII